MTWYAGTGRSFLKKAVRENSISPTVYSQTWLRDLISSSNVFGWLATADPYEERFFLELQDQLNNSAEVLWHAVCREFPDSLNSPAVLLDNILALADGLHDLEAFLLRSAAVIEPQIRDEEQAVAWKQLMVRGHAQIRKNATEGSWLLFLAGIASDFTRIEPSSHTDAFKARYRLALMWRTNHNIVDALQICVEYKNLSRLFFHRE